MLFAHRCGLPTSPGLSQATVARIIVRWSSTVVLTIARRRARPTPAEVEAGHRRTPVELEPARPELFHACTCGRAQTTSNARPTTHWTRQRTRQLRGHTRGERLRRWTRLSTDRKERRGQRPRTTEPCQPGPARSPDHSTCDDRATSTEPNPLLQEEHSRLVVPGGDALAEVTACTSLVRSAVVRVVEPDANKVELSAVHTSWSSCRRRSWCDPSCRSVGDKLHHHHLPDFLADDIDHIISHASVDRTSHPQVSHGVGDLAARLTKNPRDAGAYDVPSWTQVAQEDRHPVAPALARRRPPAGALGSHRHSDDRTGRGGEVALDGEAQNNDRPRTRSRN